MAVNYADFRDIAIEDYDAVVVGSGFAGAVSARQLAEEGGLRVLVIEKRAHIAGNMYDEYDEAGVLVHRYGPHIFHTNDQRAYDYLARFTEWSSYQHRVLADWYGTYMPVPFNKNSMEIAFGDEKAARLIEKLVDTFGDERKVTINELRAQEDPELQEVADFVYQNVFLYYTQKQWGLTPEEVDPSVTARVPVFISRDNRYFQDAFQGMPVDGYTRLFENLLGHEKITVCLSTEAESVFDLVFAGREEDAPLEAIHIKGVPFAGPIVYTGPLDELFLGRFGRLPYRSLDFVYETFDETYHLPCGTVNYTVTEDYTRVTEFKWLTEQTGDKTTIMREYSRAYEDPATQIHHQRAARPTIRSFRRWRTLYQNVFLYYTQKQWGLTPIRGSLGLAACPCSSPWTTATSRDCADAIDGHAPVREPPDHEKITVCRRTEAERVFDLVFAGRRGRRPIVRGHSSRARPSQAHRLHRPPRRAVLGTLRALALPLRFFVSRPSRDRPFALRHQELHGDHLRPLSSSGSRSRPATRPPSCASTPGPTRIRRRRFPNTPSSTMTTTRSTHAGRLTDALPNFHPLGRLAEYRYFNMDKVVADALAASEKILTETADA